MSHIGHWDAVFRPFRRGNNVHCDADVLVVDTILCNAASPCEDDRFVSTRILDPQNCRRPLVVSRQVVVLAEDARQVLSRMHAQAAAMSEPIIFAAYIANSSNI